LLLLTVDHHFPLQEADAIPSDPETFRDPDTETSSRDHDRPDVTGHGVDQREYLRTGQRVNRLARHLLVA
jgi:hypothetical protein